MSKSGWYCMECDFKNRAGCNDRGLGKIPDIHANHKSYKIEWIQQCGKCGLYVEWETEDNTACRCGGKFVNI